MHLLLSTHQLICCRRLAQVPSRSAMISKAFCTWTRRMYTTKPATYNLRKLSEHEVTDLESKISDYAKPKIVPIRRDEANKESSISESAVQLTDSAIARLKHLSEQRNKTQYLRLRVDSGGCYGFSYMLDMTEEPESNDIVVDRKGAKMVIDDVSLPLVRGATIDWQDRLIGQAFIVLANPQSSGGCGCGASFEVKMD